MDNTFASTPPTLTLSFVFAFVFAFTFLLFFVLPYLACLDLILPSIPLALILTLTLTIAFSFIFLHPVFSYPTLVSLAPYLASFLSYPVLACLKLVCFPLPSRSFRGYYMAVMPDLILSCSSAHVMLYCITFQYDVYTCVDREFEGSPFISPRLAPTSPSTSVHVIWECHI